MVTQQKTTHYHHHCNVISSILSIRCLNCCTIMSCLLCFASYIRFILELYVQLFSTLNTTVPSPSVKFTKFI